MKRLLSLLLIFVMVFAMVACGEDEAVETTAATTEEPEAFVTTTILKDGASNFQIVYDNSFEAKELANRLQKVIRENFGVELPVATIDSDAEAYEIVIGDARPIAEKTIAKLRGELDFAMKVEENTLVLCAADTLSYSYLGLYLEREVFAANDTKELTLDSDDNLYFSRSGLMDQNYIEYAFNAEESVTLEELFSFRIYENATTTLPYRIYIPFNYDSSKSYPLLVNLHGAGLRGNDNIQHLKFLDKLMFQTELPLDDAIIIAPQCPEGEKWVDTSWARGSYSISSVPESNELKAVVELVKELMQTYSVDEKRIYACGFSMGGYGTWDLLMRHSDLFCAGIPMCGAGDPTQASTLKNVGIWAVHGAKDPTVPVSGSRDMAQAMEAAGATKFYYTEHSEAEHDVWNSTYSSGMIFNWLFEQKKA